MILGILLSVAFFAIIGTFLYQTIKNPGWVGRQAGIPGSYAYRTRRY